MNILAFPRINLTPWLRERVVTFNPAFVPDNPVLLPRTQLEGDPTHLQLIPYAVLTHPDSKIWAYRRTGGDQRLHGSCSIGVGGHIDANDACDTVIATARAALIRELAEELQNPPSAVPPDPAGWIHEFETAVGRVHLGLVWLVPWDQPDQPVPFEHEALQSIGFIDPTSVTTTNQFEIWSVLAASLFAR